MAAYRYFHEGQLKEDPTTGTKCRTGQLNHQFVEQKFVGGVWIGIGDNDGVRYGDVAGAGCRFREGMRDGDYVVDVEIEIAGFLLAEGDGWVNCGSVSGAYWIQQYFKDGESFDNGKLIFGFDDGLQSVYDNGLPLFQTKGKKYTHFINGKLVGTANHLTWAEIQTMTAAGMDIQCHGWEGGYLTLYTDVAASEEYTKNNILFLANGLSVPQHTAYSVGDYNDHSLNITDNYRLTGRGTNNGYTNRKSSKYTLLGLGGLATGMTVAIKAAMDIAQTNKEALILWGHEIGVVGISVADLEEIIDHAITIGMDIITHAQLYDLMLYIDIRASRDCADNQIDIICKNKLSPTLDSISLERSDDDGATYNEIHVFSPGETDYSDTGLTLNKNYYYRARGFRGTKYLPYSRIMDCSTLVALTLTATGNGTGVTTFRGSFNDKTIVTLDGAAKFYSDAGGTLDESSTHTFVGGVATTIYIKCTSGTANMIMSRNNMNVWEWWLSGTNAPSLGGDLGVLVELTSVTIVGNNTLICDLSKLILCTYFYMAGGTLTGSLKFASYYNEGGKGNRSSLITVSSSTGLFWGGSMSDLIDGNLTPIAYLHMIPVAGHFMLFDFKVGVRKIITDGTNLGGGAVNNELGIWKWQGSNEASATPSSGSFVDIGGTFTLKPAFPAQSLTTLNGNNIAYRHYRLLGVSGSIVSTPNLNEFEFLIANE